MKTAQSTTTIVKLLAIVALILLTIPLAAQEYHTNSNRAIKKFREGLDAYQERNDPEALELLAKAIQIDDEFLEAYILRAEVYNDNRMYDKMVADYQSVISIDPNFAIEVYYYLGEGLIKTGQYEEAQKQLQHFAASQAITPDARQKTNRLLNQCEFALDAIANPVDFEPVNMGENINTPYSDYLPSLTIDEQTLITTVCVGGDYNLRQCQEDFFVSHKQANGEWSKAENMGAPVNTRDNEGAQTISADGNLLFFTACNRPDSKGGCDIYFSMQRNGQWTQPANLGFPINTQYWESQPSISADGRTLYFASNRPGGIGDKDLWMSELQNDGTWSRPENLGYTINTVEAELSPFIHPDNNTLYFSSDGHIGMGSLDLFVSRRDDKDNWGKPENLGYPINSYEEESSLILNAKGDYAFFATDRIDEGFGGLDIYSFEMPLQNRPQAVTYVKGIITHAETGQRMPARCELIDLETGKLVVEVYASYEDGEFLVPLPIGENYALNISKDGFLFYSENFSLKNFENSGEPYLLNVALIPIKVGKGIVLRNVFFETDSYQLKAESNVELNKLVDFLKNNPTLNIEIGGHTDNVGGAEYNQTLSENRAKSVYNYLVSHGIDEARLQYKGYGLSEPIATNDTEEGRAQNRRTEFRIIE